MNSLPGSEAGAVPEPSRPHQARGDRLTATLYRDLKRIAKRMLRSPRQNSMQLTDLVHEAYVRLEAAQCEDWRADPHFLGAAGRAMRSVIVDHARSRGSLKRRPLGSRVPLDDLCDSFEERSVDLLALDNALTELAAHDESMARAVELRFFVGLSVGESAKALGLPRRTFDRHWAATRSWLYDRIR